MIIMIIIVGCLGLPDQLPEQLAEEPGVVPVAVAEVLQAGEEVLEQRGENPL